MEVFIELSYLLAHSLVNKWNYVEYRIFHCLRGNYSNNIEY